MKLTRVERLAAELFKAVESAQGFAYVSDGEAHAGTVESEFFRRTRGRLEWSKEVTLKLREFLKKHGQLNKRMKRLETITVGDTVYVKPARRRAKVLRRNPSMKGSVALDRFVDGFRCWHVKDLKLIRRK